MLKPDWYVVDGICGDPTFEEGGKPVVSNRVLVGADPVLLDSYAAVLLGHNPQTIDYLGFCPKIIDQQNCTAVIALRSIPVCVERSQIPLKIVQEFRGKKCAGFGVGNCDSGCQRHIPGCPPTATEIIKELTN